VQPLATNLLGAKPKTGMNSLLDQHSNLVNLDNLVTDSKKEAQNPFENTPQNPFQAVKSAQKPAMNQLLQQSSPWQQQTTSPQQGFNPFT